MIAQWELDLKRGGEWPTVVMLELEARLRRLASSLLPVTSLSAADGRARRVLHAERIAQVISRRFTQSLTVHDIAQEVNLHPNYAMTLFRQMFGVSIVERITQHRVAHAQQLLATTELKVLEIAMRSGFGCSSQFYASFRRICGVSPRAYRRSLAMFVEGSHEDFDPGEPRM